MVTIIGSSNVDIIVKSKKAIIPGDSNPAVRKQTYGGVGRNIAENLARLGVKVNLVSAVGDDAYGRQLLNDCASTGVNVEHCLTKKGATSTYIAVLDKSGEMHVAMVIDSAMLTIGHIKKCAGQICKSDIILLDTGLEEKMVIHILEHFKGNDIYVDCTSVTKAKRVKDVIGRFHTIKMNKLEGSYLTGMELDDEASLRKAGDYFLNKGVKRVIISLGQEGFYYQSDAGHIRLRPTPISPKNATGAGDALMAGVVYCSLNNKCPQYTADFAQAMARNALMSEATVSKDINERTIINELSAY